MRTPDRPFAFSVLARSLALALAGAALADGVGVAATPVRIRDLPRAPRHVDAGPTPAGSNLSVTNCADSGPGSLRQAMLDARNNTTVDFSQLHCSTITLTTGALTDPNADSLKLLATPLVVNGKPQPVLTIDAGASSRVIEHHSGELYLRGIALRHGRSTEGKGGCVYSTGHVVLTAVTVSNCTAVASGANAAFGGGIWSDDQVDLVYSTVSGNVAMAVAGGYSYGGGVFSSYGFYSVFSTVASNVATGFGYGGGVSVSGYAMVRSSAITSNASSYGAGLELIGTSYDPGNFSVHNSTIASNHASGFAAGIEASGPLDVHNSTIAFNIGDHANTADHPAGIFIKGAQVLTLVSSIVARNTQVGVEHDIGGSGTLTGSANLVMNSSLTLPAGTLSADPLLAPFGNYGGQTGLMGLQPGSPAINAGSNPLGTLCDQRGGTFVLPSGTTGVYQRTVGAATDIGAFEYGAGDLLFADGFEGGPPFSCYPS